MTQVNPCLKRLFFIFNIFFAVIGGVIILLTVLCQILTGSHGGDEMEGRNAALIALYVVGVVTLIVAALGAYGAHRESRGALIAFLVFMVIGSLLMLRAGIPVAIAKPQVEELLETRFRNLLPLNRASDDVKEMADSLQLHMKCCGLFGYEDWETDIPDSCMCNAEEVEVVGECKSITYSNIFHPQRKYIYAKACFPILMHYVTLSLDIGIAVVFTLAVLALLGMALSSVMIHQMRRRSNTIVMTVPAIFTSAPPKYQELHNPPGY